MSAPTSTYRLQIRPAFTLIDAAAVVPYLADLGVGAVYLSPILTSGQGSDHGYDTVDPTTIDPARGGEAGWATFVAACREHGLGIVVDIVPNHMGVRVARDNAAWWGLLRDGQASEYARWFDVDWSAGQVLLPILGAASDVELVTLDTLDDEPVLRYDDTVLPCAPGTVSPGDDVAHVLARQHYRLADWREASTSLNYRRFFTIVDLAGVRVEDPAVFTATHARVLRWIADGEIDGLRIDHPDGLRDPGAYLARLREAFPGGWLVTEKILAEGEDLPAWAHDGTVGYDALREVTHVLTPVETVAEWDRLWREIGGGVGTALDCEDAGKLEMATSQLVAEARRIASLVGPDAANPRSEVVQALQHVAAQFRVYRTYLPFGAPALESALARAKQARLDLAATIDELTPILVDGKHEVAQRFQQYTGPVLAKGVEDTAFYRWNRLLPLNEVGGAPEHESGSLTEFHEAMRRRQETYPHGMTTLSTHDTKRSEDVRAIMLAMAEMPEAFEPFARLVASQFDDKAFAFALAQIQLCGPADPDRVTGWATKALREAGVSSSWTEPNVALESRVAAWVRQVSAGEAATTELAAATEALSAAAGAVILTQKAIQLMMPGVPDTYQGTEGVDDSLVDPDNRRTVDFGALAASLPDGPPSASAQCPIPGCADRYGVSTPAAKQWLVRQVLRLRRERPELFGAYAPLLADGPAADRCVAFDRGGAVLVATRTPVALARDGGWRGTTLSLPDGLWRDVLRPDAPPVAGRVAVAAVLAALPVAVLARED